jgi:hypothetical protein
MTYACPTWELAADTCRLKLQGLRINPRPFVNFPRRTLTNELHVAFNIPYEHDFITQLCR